MVWGDSGTLWASTRTVPHFPSINPSMVLCPTSVRLVSRERRRMRQVHQRGVFVAEAIPASRMLLSAEKGAQGLMLGIILAPPWNLIALE
jgi:hypothetical protein